MPLVLTRDLVVQKLREHFPDPAVAEEALHSLDRYGDREWHVHQDLVHLAIIKLSEGKLWLLREHVQKARKDFHDVLVLAQQPEQWQHAKAVWPMHQRRLKVKPLSAGVQAAMQERDRVRWERWLASAGA